MKIRPVQYSDSLLQCEKKRNDKQQLQSNYTFNIKEKIIKKLW